MKKLKLNLSNLKVESFSTGPEIKKYEGTVYGNGLDTQPPGCPVTDPCTAYGPTCSQETCEGRWCEPSVVCVSNEGADATCDCSNYNCSHLCTTTTV